MCYSALEPKGEHDKSSQVPGNEWSRTAKLLRPSWVRFLARLMQSGLMPVKGWGMMTSIMVAVWLILLPDLPQAYCSDWAYECPDSAKSIYVNRATQIPCGEISNLMNRNEKGRVYIAIRDAGLFGDTSCSSYLNDLSSRIDSDPYLRDVIAFYRLRMGDSSQLKILVDTFDREAKVVGDHAVVELFGFLSDWEHSGRRLARHAKHSDGAASELLCSALSWRRFLYGEEEFRTNWFKYGRAEAVDESILRSLYKACR